MSITEAAVRRIVASSLLALGMFLLGCLSYWQLVVATLPAIDLPTIIVTAALPGANAETMAATVATPLERRLGRLAAVTEISSVSSYGNTQITIQFSYGRDVDGAAIDVQSAINAASNELPKEMPSRPVYKKINPVIAPIILIAVTSDALPLGTLYDFADTVIRQKLSEVDGVANVTIQGATRSAIRIRVNSERLASLGLGLDDVRRAISSASMRRPIGSLQNERQWETLIVNDQLESADEYKSLIIAAPNGVPVRLGDIATVIEDVADDRIDGRYNGNPALFVFVQRKSGANIVDTVERVRKELPGIRRWLPPTVNLNLVIDRADEIKATLYDAKRLFVLTTSLVIVLVLAFLRNIRATLIASLSIPISLAGTFLVMRLLGYSLDLISLLGLMLAIGFVVDDAIVMIENTIRLREEGHRIVEATLISARQISFTILSITISLVAAFAPFFFFAGVIGALLREFAVTLCTAIVTSAIVSLTLTPALCACFLREPVPGVFTRVAELGARLSAGLVGLYGRTLRHVLSYQRSMLTLTIALTVANVVLFGIVPRGFLPTQDSGAIFGITEGAPDVSFATMSAQQREISARIMADPAVEGVSALVGASGSITGIRTGRFFITLKPFGTRENVNNVIARLRQTLADLPGTSTYMVPIEDINVGAREGKGQYQYTLQGENWPELERSASLALERLRTLPELKDVGADHEARGLQVTLQIDLDKAAKLGISPQVIDDTLYSAFGQRQISLIYDAAEQHQVILDIKSRGRLEVDSLQQVYIKAPDGSQIPLRAIATLVEDPSPLTIPHQSEFPAITLTFNLASGVALGQAVSKIQAVVAKLDLPAGVHGSFEGKAGAFFTFSGLEPYLLIGALLAVYIVLGVLYESYVHPLTILSTLPSAGLGALLALWVAKLELSLIAFIGIILLVGIVKKNAILIIDFALKAERLDSLSPREAIIRACELRFRPILMTNFIAILGALPLVFAAGPGANIRQPLGAAVAGGLIVSQLLTLYSTPVIYLYMDHIRKRFSKSFVGEPNAEAARGSISG